MENSFLKTMYLHTTEHVTNQRYKAKLCGGVLNQTGQFTDSPPDVTFGEISSRQRKPPSKVLKANSCAIETSERQHNWRRVSVQEMLEMMISRTDAEVKLQAQ